MSPLATLTISPFGPNKLISLAFINPDVKEVTGTAIIKISISFKNS
ncbi:hypothetical protein ES705_49958 [subsurface metagenome]